VMQMHLPAKIVLSATSMSLFTISLSIITILLHRKKLEILQTITKIILFLTIVFVLYKHSKL
jgi:hypothetical protein